ncbi:MAG: RnfABCDGE type electron transport complex subunit D [Rhizobiaceae bacterium]|nr:RnfABCDGE type electron transport complex subunit D [Rhizobiaceae bacterium]
MATLTASAAISRAASLPGLVQTRPALLLLVALAAPMVVLFFERGGRLALVLAVGILVAAFWSVIFAFARKRVLDAHFLVAGAVSAALLPVDVPLWQLAMSLSFGMVVGEQIFGGRGFSFLSPAVAALAFQFFSFPATYAPAGPETLAALVLVPGMLLLVVADLVSWRVLVGFAVGFGLWMLLHQSGLPDGSIFSASLALGLVFLVADPAPGPATNSGRYVHGFLAGMLVVVLGAAADGAAAARTVVFAALLASIFTPLADRIAVLVNVNRRRRRHG